MTRRLLAACAALVLLVAGSLVLLAYVRGADARALAGARPVEVLVVDEPVPAGTSAEELAAFVTTQTLPAKAALPGRVTDLSDLSGRIAAVDLSVGEQLLTSRFQQPGDRLAPGTVAVPDGMQEVSVLLEPQRAVGGRLAAGDRVGVLISITSGTEPTTHAVLHSVLVTQVQGAPAPVDPAVEAGPETASAGAPVPSSSLMVTLAVTAAQAEAVVFGVEHGTLWLSSQPDGAVTGGTQVISPATIYGRSFS